jgi:ADP-heptose:LPS heptosyltransferase
MFTAPAKILLVRNDRLGDFMLAYPTFLLLKRSLPRASIHALVPAYTSEMAECCEGVDAVVLDPGPEAAWSEQLALQRRIRRERYDALITLHSTMRVGMLTHLAGIPYRVAPASKLAQVFYNKRVVQRRSSSARPEHAYNLELGRRFLADFDVVPLLPKPPYLHFPDRPVAALRERFCGVNGVPTADRLVFLHPRSGGSAGNLSVEQYAALARSLRSERPFTLVITAGPGEEGAAELLSALLGDQRHVVHRSREGLRSFAMHLQFADLFISGSTGPLHVAGALDRPTAAFYTRRRSATALRWQTLNSPERRLAFSPPESAAEEDMSGVDVAGAAETIRRTFLDV